jgi:hypothetical protein
MIEPVAHNPPPAAIRESEPTSFYFSAQGPHPIPTATLGAEELLILATLSTADTQLKRAESSVDAAAQKREDLRLQIQRALAGAAGETSDAGFWGKVGGIGQGIGIAAVAVGAAASLVCTAGLSAPAVLALGGALLSAGSLAINETELDVQLGPIDLSDALGFSGALMMGASTLGASQAAQLTTAGKSVVGGMKATGLGTQSVARVGEGICTSSARNLEADARENENTIRDLDFQTDQAIELMETALATRTRAFQAIHAVLESKHRANVATLTVRG